jgi:hypothetical protein
MANFTYSYPKRLSGVSYFGGQIPSLDRLRTLLILSGHGEILSNSKKIILKNDYMNVPVQNAGRFKVAKLISKIPSCTEAQLKSLLAKAATKNIDIHSNIFREVMHCVAHYEQGSYIASFLHLYRLIEHTALYLPLVTVISKGVNNLTFNQYKQIINHNAKSDLSVLKTFSLDVLDPSFKLIIARYSFSGTNYPRDNCNVISKLLGQNAIINSGSDFIEIKYEVTDRLIIGFRNHFFHYLYHVDNISLRDLRDPDEFLQICLPHFIAYFSFLYRELLIAEWDLWA